RNPDVLYIEHIVVQLAADGVQAGVGTLKHLRQPAQAGPDPEPVAILRENALEPGHDLGPLRSRTDEAHLAPQAIDQLGQFVDMAGSQDPADWRDAWISATRPHGPRLTLALLIHRPDLVNGDDSAQMA